MFDHVGLQAADVQASAEYFGAVLAPLAIVETARFPAPIGLVVGFAGTRGPQFWVSPTENDGPGHEVHVAFTAPDRAAVVAVHEAVVAAGGEILHQPRIFPEYHENYYGVFFRDLDGNNIEVVCQLPETSGEFSGLPS